MTKKIDYVQLAKDYPPLQRYIYNDAKGKPALSFNDRECQRVLCQAQLQVYYNLKLELKEENLIPNIPSKVDYLHWIKTFISKQRINVQLVDIGTGASCIYPLLACRIMPKIIGRVVATELGGSSAEQAQNNININNLDAIIKLHIYTDQILPAADLNQKLFTITMCNPPFYKSREHMLECLAQKSSKNVTASSNNIGLDEELCTEGGEVAFVLQMMAESLKITNKNVIYTTLLGFKSSVNKVERDLPSHRIRIHATHRMQQGKTARWLLAWKVV